MVLLPISTPTAASGFDSLSEVVSELCHAHSHRHLALSTLRNIERHPPPRLLLLPHRPNVDGTRCL